MSSSLFGFLISFAAFIAPPIAGAAIFGHDDRTEIINSIDPRVQLWSTGILAQIDLDDIVETSNSYITKDELFHETYCPEVRFNEQRSLAHCTAFLIKPDVIVTAGHCIQKNNFKNYVWVLDFQSNSSDQTQFSFPKANVFKARRLLHQRWDRSAIDQPGSSTAMEVPPKGTDLDYAVLQLDRETNNRFAFESASPKEFQRGERIATIGFPNGIPMKFTDNGAVLKSYGSRIAIDLDVFHGNSGGPIINLRTGNVLGIFSEAGSTEDYLLDPSRGCMAETKYSVNETASSLEAAFNGLLPQAVTMLSVPRR